VLTALLYADQSANSIMLQNRSSITAINTGTKVQLHSLKKKTRYRSTIIWSRQCNSEEEFPTPDASVRDVNSVSRVKIAFYICFIPVVLLLIGRISGGKGGK